MLLAFEYREVIQEIKLRYNSISKFSNFNI